MVKSTSIFVCQSCSYEAGKWMGRCPQCNAWNSFLEEAMPDKKTSNKNITQKGKKQTLIKLSEIDKQEHKRLPTGVSELDRTLGGGLVEGSLVLLSGDPGIGKSTLVSQVLENIGGIYACAEESPRQVKLRFERMSAKGESVYFVPDNQLENILATVESQKTLPKILVIDSIQTVFTAFIRSSIGSASQIKECANILLQFAKKTGVCVFIIGHITKEGAIAGPKILEHLVDTVLYLAGDKNHQGRLLHCVKNRFGATDELGLFDMTEKGLISLKDPSILFSAELGDHPGRAMTITIQGFRPLPLEVQALCVKSKLAMPRRVAQGISLSKLQVLAAVLQKHLHLPLYEYDIFVSLTGGLKISEPAIDLPVAAAIYSSYKNKSLPPKTVYFGEIGLLGDIRPVAFSAKRQKEAGNMKYPRVVSAENGQKWLKTALG